MVKLIHNGWCIAWGHMATFVPFFEGGEIEGGQHAAFPLLN